MKKKAFIIFRDYAMITLSCLLYAFSFNCFFQPNNLAMGGFTGLAQVLNKLIPVLPIGTTVFVMNVPLMIIGVKKQGWNLLFSSVFAITVSSVMIDTMAALWTFPTMDPLLACLYGGVLMGISLGVMMLKNATTGGTELAARLLKYVIRHLSIGKLCLVIDITVVSCYALVFGNIPLRRSGNVCMLYRYGYGGLRFNQRKAGIYHQRPLRYHHPKADGNGAGRYPAHRQGRLYR